MIQYADLQAMTENLAKALEMEYAARLEVEHLQASTLAEAMRRDRLDGKNKELREIQIADVKSGDVNLQQIKLEAELKRAERKRIEALIKLTTAFLYSVAGRDDSD